MLPSDLKTYPKFFYVNVASYSYSIMTYVSDIIRITDQYRQRIL